MVNTGLKEDHRGLLVLFQVGFDKPDQMFVEPAGPVVRMLTYQLDAS